MTCYGAVDFILIECDWENLGIFHNFSVIPSRSIVHIRMFGKCYFWMCHIFVALPHAVNVCEYEYASVVVYFRREKAIINKTISLNDESQCQTLNFFMFHNPVLDE